MDKTKKDLRRMEDAGVIVRVEQPTDWCTPMVVGPKKDDVRICVDLTKLNESVRRERHEMPSVEYTVVRRKNILKVRCKLWLLASSVGRRICLTDNLHHPLWKILFQAIALRHFISAGTLPEKDVKWMTYSSSERRKISTMNASVKCLEDSGKRMSH